MGHTSFERFEDGLREDISPEEHAQARRLFEDTVTDAMGSHMQQTLERDGGAGPWIPPDRVLLKTILPSQAYVSMYIGKYADSEGLYGTVNLRWLSGDRAGETTLYGPDDQTKGVLRRDVSAETQNIIGRKLLQTIRGYLDAGEDAEFPTQMLKEATQDPEAAEALAHGERTRPVGLEEVRWLAGLIEHAVPHGRF